jgi:pimeloyl-ACP methyl ester carboxylesterase
MSTTGRRWRAGVACVAAALIAAVTGPVPARAAVAPASSTSLASSSAVPPPGPIAWTPCPDTSAYQCGSVSVPLDYRHPNRASLSLAVMRARPGPSGVPSATLLLNPGGPGESGNQILPVMAGLLPAAVRQHFDLVSFDPRGTGASAPLRCGTPPSAVTSVLPVPAGPSRALPGTHVFTVMAQACQQGQADLSPFIDTTATARDMDRIRQALGVATISYYGLSYGTALGAEYAVLFPHRITSMVLDGAVDVDASLSRQAIQQAPAAERALKHLLASCQGTTCSLGADPVSFFRSLAASLARSPLPAPGAGDPYPVTVGDLDTATLLALSVPGFVPSYYSALVAAGQGNGSPLRALALGMVTDLDGQPLVDALWAITCNDARVHPGPRSAGALAATLARRYPLIGAFAVTYNLGGCVSWPTAGQPIAPLRPAAAIPILVIGTTGDPNTPLIGARHLAEDLPGSRLLVWQGWGHTWLLSGPGDRCMASAVTTYLGGGGLPLRGTICR